MQIQIFPLRIGLILLTIGIIWIAITFSETNKESGNFSLEKSDSESVPIKLEGKGIGFYLISSDNYQNNILAKVIDSSGNFLDIKRISNKVTVNYFHFEHSDQVTLEITNLSDKQVQISTTIGDTKFEEITLPAIFMFLGASFMMFVGYTKLKNYIMAQPDENSS